MQFIRQTTMPSHIRRHYLLSHVPNQMPIQIIEQATLPLSILIIINLYLNRHRIMKTKVILNEILSVLL